MVPKMATNPLISVPSVPSGLAKMLAVADSS